MDINLNKIGKRYRFEWIFKNLTFQFQHNQQYAILGANGSGKSTLLKILSGHLTPSKGEITFNHNGIIDIDDLYKQVSYAAPYMDLIEELTLTEMITFHEKFKPFLKSFNGNDILELTGLGQSKNKPLSYFSSGMKQRVKLALSICSESSLILLDEPTTNLDKQGVAWYRDLIKEFGRNRTLIIASNIEQDYDFCTHQLNIMEFKPVPGKGKRRLSK